jgi:hypothetical protein
VINLIHLSEDGLYELEILSAGRHPQGENKWVNLSVADLEQVAETHDPSRFRAPLIVTSPAHSVPTSDKDAHAAEFAYGTPDRLRVVGNKLLATFSKLSQKFVDWTREGAILNVSSSLYPPGHPGNPTPGKYSLRHIAGLGATPPAIKDLAPLSLSEWEGEGVLDFGEFDLGDGEGCLNFGDYWAMSTCEITAMLFGKLRDMLIEQQDAEKADEILPMKALGMLAQNKERDYLEEELRDLRKRIGMLEGDRPPSPVNYSENQMNEEELKQAQDAADAQAAALAKRAADLDKREADLRRAGFEQFCETELKGKLIPAIAPASEVVDFMEHLVAPSEVLSFSEEGKADAQPLEWFQGFLKRALSQQVDFGEQAGGEPPRSTDEISLSEVEKARAKKAEYYAKKSGVK